MNKKQLLKAITALATDLNQEVVMHGLDVDGLESLHEKLVAEKAELDNSTRQTVKKEKVVIEFLGPYQRYANGDIAGFDADVAEKILALKPAVAKAYQESSTDLSEQTE